MIRKWLKRLGLLLSVALMALCATQVPGLVDAYLKISEVDSVPTFEAPAGSHQIVVAAEGELSGVQTTWLRAPPVRTGNLRIAWLADNGALLDGGDVVVRFDDVDARIMLDKNARELEAYQHRITKSDVDAQGERQVNVLDLEDAELAVDYSGQQVRKDETIFSRWEIRESVVSAALARYRRDFVEHKGELQQRLWSSDRHILTIESGEVQRGVEQAQQTLNSLSLRMPKAGIVLHPYRPVNPLQAGVDVYPNARLLEVASLDDYRGTIRVAEKEATTLAVGQSVTIVVPALSSEPLRGQLTEIGPVARQFSRLDPRKYFECKVTLAVGPDLMAQLRPGMKLTADVLVATLYNGFVVPKSAVHRSDKGYFVFEQEENGFRKQPVTIRGTDHAFFVVEGLQPGSKVALRNPNGKADTYLPDFNAPVASSTRRFIIAFD